MTPTNRNEAGDWTSEGSKINDPSQLQRIRHELETRGPIVLKYWHYCGAAAPTHVAFDDYEDFLKYLGKNAQPGDAFDAWSLSDLCQGFGLLASGKYPDADGCIPRGGAY
jgi:hypothetical protein